MLHDTTKGLIFTPQQCELLAELLVGRNTYTEMVRRLQAIGCTGVTTHYISGNFLRRFDGGIRGFLRQYCVSDEESDAIAAHYEKQKSVMANARQHLHAEAPKPAKKPPALTGAQLLELHRRTELCIVEGLRAGKTYGEISSAIRQDIDPNFTRTMLEQKLTRAGGTPKFLERFVSKDAACKIIAARIASIAKQ